VSLVVMHLSSNALTAAFLQMPFSGEDCSRLGGVPARNPCIMRGGLVRPRFSATVTMPPATGPCEKERGYQVMVCSSVGCFRLLSVEFGGEGKKWLRRPFSRGRTAGIKASADASLRTCNASHGSFSGVCGNDLIGTRTDARHRDGGEF
jgi:hypothetical protein